MTVTCYIGLGSNLDDPIAQLHTAISQLRLLAQTRLQGVSRFYASKPMGPQDQPDYVNAVVCLQTDLEAETLLQQMFVIERQQGRQRDVQRRWGPRTLDLDLLLYGQAIITQPQLTIPHAGLCERSFVVLPLFDLAPTLRLPTGKRLSDCLTDLKLDDLHPLSVY